MHIHTNHDLASDVLFGEKNKTIQKKKVLYLIQAKTASDSLSLNEITFIQKTNFLLDPLWSCGVGFPVRSRDKLL